MGSTSIRRRRCCAASVWVVILFLLIGGRLRAQVSRHWVVVCAPGLEVPLAPLVEWRRSAGGSGAHVLVATMVVGNDANDAIRSLETPPDWLLIVGDDVEGPSGATWRIPSQTRNLYRWRRVQPETFPSDALFGDRDGDLVPDFAVGRIPARTPEQVAVVVKKIIAWEKRPLRVEDLRMVAWGGAAGYGPALDKQATKMLQDTVRKNAPSWIDTWMISAAEGEALCGWPPDQATMFEKAVREGAVLSAFVAHASSQHVLSMRHQGKRIVYPRARAEKTFASGDPVAPMVFLTCDSGRFQDQRPCIAESLLFAPGGPVATIAATTESHPLTNYYTGKSLLRELDSVPNDSAPNLGRLWLNTQRRGLKAKSFLIEMALKDAEGKLEKDIDVKKLKRDQPLMFALLGDPLTRLKRPHVVPLVVKQQTSGVGWQWSQPSKMKTVERVEWRAKRPPRMPTVASPDAAQARERHAEAIRGRSYRPIESPDRVVKKAGWLRVSGKSESGTLMIAVGKIE